jgi:hypothetical protein
MELIRLQAWEIPVPPAGQGACGNGGLVTSLPPEDLNYIGLRLYKQSRPDVLDRNVAERRRIARCTLTARDSIQCGKDKGDWPGTGLEAGLQFVASACA